MTDTDKKPPKPANDTDTPLPQSDKAMEVEEKGEPDGGGNFA
jgi:hypothetical protein